MSETATTAAQLSAEIAAAQNFSSGNITIALGTNITLSSDLEAINLAPGVTLTIQGNGHTLSGAGKYEGFFVYQGHVDIDNLTITDAAAVGGAGGGGGAGLGGGLFVAGVNTISANDTTAGGDVTLSNVSFTGDSATGGAGGTGGGGGLGGSGASGKTGGGGGIGNSAAGGGGNGIVVGAPGGGSGGSQLGSGGAGGSSGGGGGNGAFGGGGGGVGGGSGVFARGGNGGFGGGGGADAGRGGSGGFGGGGGETNNPSGGAGGFGGGGCETRNPGAGTGGFGGGGGSDTRGGGGLGAGGDIFVQQGGTLTIEGGTLGLGAVSGGAGATTGAGLGTAMFLQGDQTQTLQAAAGQTLTIAGGIADETGSDPTMQAGDGTGTGAGALLIEGPGTVEFTAANSYTGGTTIEDGALDLVGRGSAGTGPISFAGPGSSLSFAVTNAPAATINGFVAGDTIDITDLHTPGITSFSFSNDILTIGYIGDGNAPLTLSLDETNFQPGDTFAFSRDATGGTDITTDTACFAAGTRLLTAQGALVRVEDLREGDELEIFAGGSARIRWIGRRTLAPRRHQRPDAVQPVLITAGALGQGLPWRDLVVSPDHALYLDRHLIPAKALTNGFTIRQLDCATVTYYHIELLDHDVLFAEGAPAESYLETGNRGAFEDGGESLTLHPDFAQGVREQHGYAPFAESGKIVEAVRQRILDRAGIETTADPGVQLHFEHGEVIIASRSAIPGEIFADPRDRRRLGVKIASLAVDGRDVPLHHPALVAGWYGCEPDGRWTDGNARIPAALCGESQTLEFTLAAALRYPVRPMDALRPARAGRAA